MDLVDREAEILLGMLGPTRPQNCDMSNSQSSPSHPFLPIVVSIPFSPSRRKKKNCMWEECGMWHIPQGRAWGISAVFHSTRRIHCTATMFSWGCERLCQRLDLCFAAVEAFFCAACRFSGCCWDLIRSKSSSGTMSASYRIILSWEHKMTHARECKILHAAQSQQLCFPYCSSQAHPHSFSVSAALYEAFIALTRTKDSWIVNCIPSGFPFAAARR